jgi:hypothetical protein
MARFYINQREFAPPLEASSLDQILKYAEQSHIPPNSVIRQIHIDGIPMMPDSSPGDQSGVLSQLQSRDKVEIFTGTLEEIARDSITEAIDYLARIEAETPSLAMGFQVSPGSESFESLRQLYEGLYWLNVLLGKLEACFREPLKDVLIQGVPAQEHHQKFISILKQLIESHEKGDLVLISDTLEFEILPLVPVWKEMFSIILNKVVVAQ